MTDDPADHADHADDRAPRLDSGHSEAWIERIAESEGISRDEVVDRLVSSYWTLKEIHGLVETSEESDEADGGEWPLDVGLAYSESLSAELTDLRDRVDGLEGALPGDDAVGSASELTAQVKMLAQRVAAVEESLRDRQDGLDSRLDRELDNLETILEYLIETTDDLAAEVEALADEQRADRRRRAAEDRLADLKHLASRLDVRSAKCAYCDTRVEIALLPTPECPQCDRSFTDIEPATGWFGFGSNVLTVTEEPYLKDDSADRERTASGTGEDGPAAERPDGVGSSSDGGEAAGDVFEEDSADPFVWGDQRG